MGGTDDQHYADETETAASPSAVAGRLAAVVLADGRVRLASDTAGAVFPGEGVVAADDVYECLERTVPEAEVAAMRDAAREGTVHRGVFSVETDDEPRYYRHEGYPITGVEGDRLLVVADVTHVAERDARRSLFETLVEHAQDGLYATDGDGRVVECNESLCSLLGSDRDALVGRPAVELLAEGDRPTWRDAVDALGSADSDRVGHELAYRTASGDRLVLSVHLSARGDGGGVVAAARDVSEREARERRLEQYRTLVESAGDPMWALDEAGRVTLCNEAMCSFLGLDRDAVVGGTVAEVLPPAAATRVEDTLARLRADADRQWDGIDLEMRDADGTARQFEVTLGPIRAGDDVTGWVGTFRDVTDRRRQTTKLELLKRVFAVVVRHDIEESANTIRVRAEALADRLDGREAEMAEMIREQCAVLARTAEKSAVVEGLVDAEPEPVERDVATLVDAAVADATEAADGDLSVDVPRGVSVRAIPGIGLAVANLVENALIHAGQSPTVRVTATVDERAVEIAVTDDGPGISEAELAALERRSETALDHASGVGLWLVDWVVEKSGGDLTFDADPSGTRATIRLPRWRSHDSAPAESATTDDGDPAVPDEGRPSVESEREDAVTVVHVADDETVRAAVQEAAADAGPAVAVIDASRVSDVVEHLDDADCVVTDRLDGRAELVAAVEAHAVPLVLYTAADHAAVDEATRAVVDSIVEQGTPATSASFLVEKALAVTASDDADDGGRDATAGLDDVPAASTIALTADGADRWRHEDGDVPAVDRSSDMGRVSECRTVTVDGQRRHVRVDRLPLTDDGAAGLAVERVQEVTGAVEREERLSLLSLLVERARDGISAVDAHGHIEYHNASFASLLGHEDMVGDHAATFMAEGELAKGQQAVQRVMATPGLDSEVLDMDFVTADGGEVTLAVHFAARRVDGEYAGLVNVARDVTERKARERRLEQYRRLVEGAGDPMVVLDPEGRVALCNAAFAAQFEQSRSDLRGRAVETVVPEESATRWHAAVERLRRGDGETASLELTLPRSDGDRRHFETTVALIREDGAFAGSVCTCRDVTERERRTDELSLLKQVLGRVLRHNLRNELTLVQGHAGLLAEETDGRSRQLARDIVDCSTDLARTSESARAAEQVVDAWDDVGVQSLETAVDAAIDALGDTVRVQADLPEDVSVSAHRALPQAVEHLVAALGDAARRDAEQPSTDPVPVQLTASVDDGVTMRASLPAHEIADDALASFAADPAMLLDRERDVARWLVAWVVERSGGHRRVESDPDPAVVVSLPTPA